MKVVAVIPARFQSQRFPGKMLARLIDKPVIAWSLEAAKKSPLFAQVVLATDDERIAQVGKDLGVTVKMTAADIKTGTDRIFSALADVDYDIAVNLQGDEPMINPKDIEKLLAPFSEESIDASTLACPISSRDLDNPNRVKVILNKNNEAIYFSRLPIPYSKSQPEMPSCSFQHIGIYAYRKTTLERFCTSPQADIEVAENLEQLRLLYLGCKMGVALVDSSSPGVDTPEDLEQIEKIIQSGISHGIKE